MSQDDQEDLAAKWLDEIDGEGGDPLASADLAGGDDAGAASGDDNALAAQRIWPVTRQAVVLPPLEARPPGLAQMPKAARSAPRRLMPIFRI